MPLSAKDKLAGKSTDEPLNEIERLQQESRRLKGAAATPDITGPGSIMAEDSSLANIVRQSTDSIVLTDRKGNIQYVNPMFEQITGYTFGEVKGKNPRILRSELASYPPGFYRQMWKTLTTGNVWKGEFLNRKKNGEDYIEEASIFPVRHRETGGIIGYGAVKKDVTLPRELEKKLKKSYEEVVSLKEKAEMANRLKSQFLSHMSHDIRTPLHGIMGFAHLLLKRAQKPQEREYLEKIKISGEGLLKLIDDILDLSKIEARQLDIERRPFRVADLMANLESIFEIQYRQKNIKFSTRVAKAVPVVVCNDRWRIHQVISNLAANALKFTGDGSVTIRVGYKTSVDRLVFKVKDTGVGIPGKYLRQIFDPFSQVHSPGNALLKGTGLGLAICKNLVTLMGGTIKVQSQVGRGTKFTVEIPAHLDEIAGDILIDELPVVPGMYLEDKRGNTILVAEDDAVSRELMAEQFKEAGFGSLLLASNGKEAVEMALEHRPDLILMDIHMPVMDGNRALTRLKKRGYKGPVIILSAFAMREEIKRSLNAGAVGYITKPIDFDRFFLMIGKFLKPGRERVGKNGPGAELSDTAGSGFETRGEYRIKKEITKKLKQVFLTDVKEKWGIIEGILKNNDFENKIEKVKSIVHGYKGNAGYFGLSVLEQAASALDQAFADHVSTQELFRQTLEITAIFKRILEENNRIDGDW